MTKLIAAEEGVPALMLRSAVHPSVAGEQINV